MVRLFSGHPPEELAVKIRRLQGLGGSAQGSILLAAGGLTLQRGGLLPAKPKRRSGVDPAIGQGVQHRSSDARPRGGRDRGDKATLG